MSQTRVEACKAASIQDRVPDQTHSVSSLLQCRRTTRRRMVWSSLSALEHMTKLLQATFGSCERDMDPPYTLARDLARSLSALDHALFSLHLQLDKFGPLGLSLCDSSSEPQSSSSPDPSEPEEAASSVDLTASQLPNGQNSVYAGCLPPLPPRRPQPPLPPKRV